MRRLCAAAALVLSVHGASASDLDFLDRVERLDTGSAMLALAYFECAQSATKEAASRDQTTPATIMAEWAAGEAAKQCDADGKALTASVGESEAAAIMAMVRGISAESALQVRRGEPPYLCADGRGCPVTKAK